MLLLDAISDICSLTWKSQHPVFEQLHSGKALIAIPWKTASAKEPYVLTGFVQAEQPELQLYALEQTIKAALLQEEVDGLRIENTAFLRQVTEDFEELTFLRSIAEHLTLDDNNQGLTRLTDYTLSLLGQIVGIEQLYFLAFNAGKSQVQSSWCDPEKTSVSHSDWQIEGLTDALMADNLGRPLVRNGIEPLELGYGIRGIRELLIVPVTTTISRIGWLVAINRNNSTQGGYSDTEYILSQNELGSREVSLLTTAAAMLASHASNLSLLEERETLLINVVRALVSAIDSRDPYTCGHSERVALFARRLALEVGLDDEACEKIYLTGLLHDLGKIGISDSVLKKEGPLTNEEFAEIQQHPDLGWSILQGLEQFAYVLPGVLHHHERYDGKGYPDQLCGDETPFEGRLLAVVDAFDAMTSDRPYRPGMPVEKAIDILAEGAGTQWDCELIDAFFRILPDIEAIRNSYDRPPLPKRKQRLASSLIDTHTAPPSPYEPLQVNNNEHLERVTNSSFQARNPTSHKPCAPRVHTD